MKTITVNGNSFPNFTLESNNNSNSPIHFTGANGFPAGVYTSFLNRFNQYYSISAADCRGALETRSSPPKHFGLSRFADDLIDIIEATHSEPVIAMGHSFGAHVSLIAAIKRPDLIKQLVLIEPASLPNPWVDLIYLKLPTSVVNRIMPLISRTQQRQRIWRDHDSFVSRYRSHPTFKHLTEQAMRAYAEHGLKERKDGQYELVFDPDWEAHIFRNICFVWKNLKKTKTPTLFIRAKHSNLYSSKMFHSQNAKLGEHFTGVEVANTYHLMPLESPEACAKTALEWLSKHNEH